MKTPRRGFAGWKIGRFARRPRDGALFLFVGEFVLVVSESLQFVRCVHDARGSLAFHRFLDVRVPVSSRPGFESAC